MATVLIAAGKDAPELELLQQLPASVQVIGIGNSLDDFSGVLCSLEKVVLVVSVQAVAFPAITSCVKFICRSD